MMFKKMLLYYHTLKYLKWTQIYYLLRLRIYKPKLDFKPSPSKKLCLNKWRKEADNIPIIKKQHITLLNQEHNILDKTIWTNKSIDKLWLYHLHYFDCLKNHDVAFKRVHLALVNRWIDENRMLNIGWDAYPLSLRIVNWISYFLAHNINDKKIDHSLAIQTRYLCKCLEFHLQANHLFANAKALIFAGFYFDGKEAARWFKKGLNLIEKELDIQVLSDGGHYELSPMYHAVVLDDLLDLIQLYKVYQKPIPELFINKVNIMLNWLRILTHGDMQIAFFNDSTFKQAPSLMNLIRYRKNLLGEKPLNEVQTKWLKSSGYCRMQYEDKVLIADVGKIGPNYQPGHAHADTLSFELSIGLQRLFVNSGISTYETNEDRMRQRRSSAHNTLTINNDDSSNVWKSFRVAERADILRIEFEQKSNRFYLSAMHNGYKKKYNAIHERIWRFDNEGLMIEDNVTGNRLHNITLHFHIHPDILIEKLDSKTVLFFTQKRKPLARLHASHDVKIIDSIFYPGFNCKIRNKKLCINTSTTLPSKMKTMVKWI